MRISIIKHKHVYILIVIIILCSSIYAWYLFNKPHQGVEKIKPVITTTAANFYHQYSENEGVGDKKFSGKVIELSGIVDDVELSDSSFSVHLAAGNALSGINCSMYFPKKKQIEPPKIGSVILIKGRCAGYLMDVNLVDCIIEK